ncbi:uncharacterized protein [Palaemon carinicauda]|uniref:uncharacterized protein n=1 Tax=Palaemon carinicauda TaxID=392227 RepID=UPI0035B57464
MRTIVYLAFFAFFTLATAECKMTRGDRKRLQDAAQLKDECKGPTQQLVHLLPPEANIMVIPAVTFASRCSGYLCTEKTRCSATKSEVREVKVAYTADGNTTCKMIPVEDHIECGCKCIAGKEQCKGHEEFDEAECECKCPESARKNCKDLGTAYDWFNGSCTCVSRVDGSLAF